MKTLIAFILTFIICQIVAGQKANIKRSDFFKDTSVVTVELSTDIRKLRGDKNKTVWLPAHIQMQFADSTKTEANIQVEPRGSFRKDNCDLASLMLNFKADSTSVLNNFKKLKLVGGCYNNGISEIYLLREYLVYKLYNIFSPMSFRVRLLQVNYKDATNKVKPYTQYAFLIEDIKDLAERNNCAEVKRTIGTESTDHNHITFVSMFEYMIGNTDYAVPNHHNIKLIAPENDTLTRPYPVPYDFDYCGVVNASYAVPDENIDIKNVRERYYRGYPRSIEEIEAITKVYNEKRDSVMQCISNFNLLSGNDRKDITKYIDQFYDLINSKSFVKSTFVNNIHR